MKLKVNYLAMYATILNNKTAKTTRQDIKVNENKPKSCKTSHNNPRQVEIQIKNKNNPLVH